LEGKLGKAGKMYTVAIKEKFTQQKVWEGNDSAL